MTDKKNAEISLEQQIETLIDVATFQSGYWAGQREALSGILKMITAPEKQVDEHNNEQKSTED